MPFENLAPGTVVVNRVTGERATVIEPAHLTRGEYLVAEVTALPGGHVSGEHYHPRLAERLEVLEGALGYVLDGERGVARPGDVLVVEPGAVHDWWNAGDGATRFRVEVRPAGHFEDMIVALWGLANEGRTNAKGIPGPLQLAVIADAYGEDIVFTKPPRWVQRLMVAILAPIGRALGRTAHDPRWEELIVESVPEGSAAG
ncbi:MAG TPA: cupin domain-containing protein [Capillimicrobium sp.]|nr:cupin domain-containing protein [Capillimicrobium sp.]